MILNETINIGNDNDMSFQAISNNFNNFQLEHDQLTDRPTDGRTEPLIAVHWRTQKDRNARLAPNEGTFEGLTNGIRL